ncbi:Methyltransferase type 11 (plasmid) [Sodalis praecaptivus]|uniref:Methyltransferase type 11 n=1 Tax=Sodalis praecaptivus TaxID=1239307 RepID=W0I037_9GAMM|nr:class I SAM-dependent methyltransferase [Sodalis praecaptivus]AHF79369.1 Methyltransferase type 11 [Sodalis praecaptivus]
MNDAAAGNILGLYQRHAAAFARQRSRRLIEKPWLDKFIAAMGGNGRLLDIGCGNGQPIAEYFIRRHLSVTGIDGAVAMLDRARSRFPQQRWLHLDMRAMALDETFEGLIAWDSFFHLPREDQKLMFPIFNRHSHKGSALMFTSGPGNGIAMGEFAGEPLYHASLAPDEYGALLAEQGFAVIDSVVEDPLCGGHTIWLCKRVE